jgi:hypothetical protein
MNRKNLSSLLLNKELILLEFWKKLLTVKQLSFLPESKKNQGGWIGKGQGEVFSVKKDAYTLIFHEKGTWQREQEVDIHFSNVFRWTLDLNAKIVSLEHLRYGLNHPIFLFHLTPYSNHSLSSTDPHLCKEDAYFGQIQFDKEGLHLKWKVIGPKKNEVLDHYYF